MRRAAERSPGILGKTNLDQSKEGSNHRHEGGRSRVVDPIGPSHVGSVRLPEEEQSWDTRRRSMNPDRCSIGQMAIE